MTHCTTSTALTFCMSVFWRAGHWCCKMQLSAPVGGYSLSRIAERFCQIDQLFPSVRPQLLSNKLAVLGAWHLFWIPKAQTCTVLREVAQRGAFLWAPFWWAMVFSLSVRCGDPLWCVSVFCSFPFLLVWHIAQNCCEWSFWQWRSEAYRRSWLPYFRACAFSLHCW